MLEYTPDSSQIFLTLSSPEKLLFEGYVNFASFPAFDGTVGVLKGHVPFFTELKKGGIELRIIFERKLFEIESGFLFVSPGSIRGLVQQKAS